MVFERIDIDDAVCPFTKFFNRFFAVGVEFIIAVEDGKFTDTVEGCLDFDGRSSTAGTDDDHFFADIFDTFVFEGLHSSDAISNRTRQDAIIVDDGVAGTDNLGGR